MHNPKILPAIALFAVMFLSAGFVSLKSWDGVVYVYLDDARQPAAIGRNLDFSNLDGSELMLASSKRLVSSARMLLKDSTVGLELGNFVVKNGEGKKVLACSAFDRVSAVFLADGMAEAGQVPKLTIEGLCKEGTDITRIQPIWIPVDQITAQTPGDLEMQVWEKDPVGITLTQMGSRWPKTWNLSSVKLFKKDSKEGEIIISPQDVRELREKPLQMTW